MVTTNRELDFFARFDLYNSGGSSAAATKVKKTLILERKELKATLQI